MRYVLTICLLFISLLTLQAQTFSLKHVTLLPPVKKPLAALPAEKPVNLVFRPTPDSYYNQHFGFFCKQEWSFQKRTGVPVRIRLGSLSTTERLEGKSRY
ncbi:MAG TPA: hypothetical protein VM802_30915 [Chitinophaga sp.]|uniref:hypothetical protein n=1 Tax=Chitinophaga sp. TaxID=1869181 RepID=UPI002CB3BF91|nr:hypothetical protein [Chitinophaga sp.]HVI49317.1 hypothetical protein [Chitinophaga sp.]